MCNFCNSGAVASNCAYGYNACANTSTSNCGYSGGCGCGNSWFGSYQSVCKDCCGNIRVRRSGCSQSCGCGCRRCGGCGCGSANTVASSCEGTVSAVPYTASVVSCLRGCGNTGYTANASANGCAGDLYYARQYGLLGASSCPCSAGYTAYGVTQNT